MYVFEHGILGGTFDVFHIGHQKLLDAAFTQSEKVTIGITKSVMYQHKLLAQQIEDYQTRKNAVEVYLNKKGWRERATIIPIDTIYGDSLKESFEAIFATHTNLKNVRLINKRRASLGLKRLRVVLIPTVIGDDNRTVSSERIRLGEIDKMGHSYRTLFDQKNVLRLPETLRDELRHPFGNVFESIAALQPFIKTQCIIAVGDIVTLTLLEKGINPSISIIDGKTRRKALTPEQKNILFHPPSGTIQRYNNKAGTIHKRVIDGYRKAIKEFLLSKQNQRIVIHGEEDLIALPAMLLAPPGSLVLYGQADLGVVINTITEEKKKIVESILKRFF